jgi:6-phosphogluconolactonase (cycloisomerase 2 family)
MALLLELETLQAANSPFFPCSSDSNTRIETKTQITETTKLTLLTQGNTLTVSNRFDATFGPGIDSLTLFSISDGLLTYVNQTSSYGSFPRTFQFNAAGDLVAIGNEISATVAVVQRDPNTGALGKLVGTVPVGPPGDPRFGGSGGLSSVAWQEAIGW